jgi:hypothetical protein
MSMNLHCEEFPLLQTPTFITYMCFSNEDGGWQGIKYRYVQWVKSQLNGVWESEKEYQEFKTTLNCHIGDLDRAARKHKKLTFTIV